MRTMIQSILFLTLCASSTSAFQDRTVDKLPDIFEPGPIANWVSKRGLELDARVAQVVLGPVAALVDGGLPSAVARSLADDFRVKPWSAHPKAHAHALGRMTKLVDDLQLAIAKAVPDGIIDSDQEINALLVEFNAAGHGIQEFEPASVGPTDNPFLVFFDQGPERLDSRLVTYDNLSTDTAEKYVLRLTDEEMIDLRLRGATMTELLTRTFAKVRQQNVKSLELAVERWENYLDKGYSQYPWESLFNGWVLDIPTLGPPENQWILGHPALGIELSTSSFDDLRVKESLNLEVLGFLHYTGSKLDKYYGGSLALTLREDLGPGLGVLAHLGKNLNLGVSWHDGNDDGRYFDEAPYLFFSIDLYRFVGVQETKFSEAMKRDLVRLPRVPGD